MNIHLWTSQQLHKHSRGGKIQIHIQQGPLAKAAYGRGQAPWMKRQGSGEGARGPGYVD